MTRLRRAAAPDAALIAEVYLSAVRVSMPWLHLAHDDDQVRRWIAGHVVADLETWVAEVDGGVAAVLALELPSDSGRFGWVEQLYVDPPHQGCGLGDRLVRLAKQRHPSGLQLWTFQRNARARTFYEHRSFTAVELTDGSGNEEHEPDVRYAWVPSDGVTERQPDLEPL